MHLWSAEVPPLRSTRAFSIDTRDEKFVNPSPFQPIREVGPHVPDGCESPLELFELFFDAHVISRIIR